MRKEAYSIFSLNSCCVIFLFYRLWPINRCQQEQQYLSLVENGLLTFPFNWFHSGFFFYFGAGRGGISCFQFSVDVVMYCWLLCYSLYFRLPDLMQFLNILYILIIHYFSSSFYIQYLPKVSNELLRWKKEKVLSSFSLMAMIL